MNPNDLRDNVIRSEGYAQGFKDGYATCAKHVSDQMIKDLKTAEKEKEEKNVSPDNL